MGMFTSGGQEDQFAWSNFSGPVVQPGSVNGPEGIILTSGSDLDRTAIGPWQGILDGAIKFFIRAQPSNKREVAHTNVPGNYGGEGGEPDWYFRNRWVTRDSRIQYTGRGTTVVPEKALTPDPTVGPDEGNYPGPVPYEGRPMWNNLPPVNNYQSRVIDLGQQAQPGELSSPDSGGTPVVQFTPGAQASLSEPLL